MADEEINYCDDLPSFEDGATKISPEVGRQQYFVEWSRRERLSIVDTIEAEREISEARRRPHRSQSKHLEGRVDSTRREYETKGKALLEMISNRTDQGPDKQDSRSETGGH